MTLLTTFPARNPKGERYDPGSVPKFHTAVLCENESELSIGIIRTRISLLDRNVPYVRLVPSRPFVLNSEILILDRREWNEDFHPAEIFSSRLCPGIVLLFLLKDQYKEDWNFPRVTWFENR